MSIKLSKCPDSIKTRCDYAKTAMTSCSICKKRFEKGEFRVSYKGSRYTGSIWYHPQCFIHAEKPFNDRVGHGVTGYETREFYGFDQLKASDQELFRGILPQYLAQKAQLKRNKHIFEMNSKELKTELKKRKMAISGKVPAMRERLRDYLQNDWCMQHQRQRDEKLVLGFCRNLEKECRMNVPLVLQRRIQEYFPSDIIL